MRRAEENKMMSMSAPARRFSVVAVIVLVASFPSGASAQAAVGTNQGKVTLTGGMDFANAYMFRGLRQDDTRVMGTYLTTPDYTVRAPMKTVITFEERSGGRPAAIKTWWYPNDLIGHRFIYH